ncbi:MAG: choice-of-anchor D domain-containing protein [Nitrospirae bacterium]|nr:choice-of-anchor D domain-containing protein [Nitrospirota bacterium]
MRQRLKYEVLIGVIAALIVMLTPLLSFGYTVNYTYDDAYRLTQVASDTGFVEAYTYDEVGNRLIFALSAANISLPQPTFDLGSSNIGIPVTRIYTVTNTGTMDLVITSIIVSGANAGLFSQSNDCATVVPSGTCHIDMTFLPTSAGHRNATLNIASNDPDSPVLGVVVTGTGVSTLTVAVNPTAGGTVTDAGTTCPSDCIGSYAVSGASASLTATPNTGYHFTGWTGDITSVINPISLPMDTNKTVTANFSINSYDITSSAGAGGTITPSGSITVDHGTNQTYAITPNSGYAIADVLIDGISAGAIASYTFSSITSGHTIEASFRTLNTLTLSVETSKGRKLAGIKAYLFKDTGTYTNLSQTTDTNGTATFSTSALASGNYKMRADYLGYQFWSPVFTLPNTGAATVLVPEQTATLSITPVLSGIKTYLFTSAGTYVNKTVTTDSSGTAAYDLPTGKMYKIRADYLSQQYWSPVTAGEDLSLTIPMSDADVTVTGNGMPISNVKVYVFNSAGTYLNISGTTDADGAVSFPLPSGIYKFRADYQSKQFWSGSETLNPDETKALTISTGGGTFGLSVLKNQTTGLANAKCYVFNQGGSPYLNLSGATDQNGQVSFSLADGAYQFRIDHLGYQFWTEVITIPQTLSQSLLIDHKDISITVQGQLGTDISPIADSPVYLFTPSGTYLNSTQNTDANGRVFFSLPARPFIARTDYLGQQFWSDAISYQDAAITIPEGIAHIHVNINNQEIAGNRVYVYGETGTYLNVSALTDSNGRANFRLPEATYTFRTDYQSQQLKVTAGIDRDITTTVEITAPLTIFRLHADTGSGVLAEVIAHVFNSTGTYLNISGITDVSGMASFSLIRGSYRIRLDYLGYQYWTDIITIPDATETVLSLPHSNRAVAIQGVYGIDRLPIADIPVYLFTPAGAYQGITRTTDPNGQAFFFLPDADYKIRADYLGAQFWSADFNATDTTITIIEGMVRLVITRAGAPVPNAKVYLFSEAGAYLGRFVTADAAGIAEFRLPDRRYNFRIDDAGQQHWSGLITAIHDQVMEMTLEIGGL